MELQEKIDKASTCISHTEYNSCKRDGYPPFDCENCDQYKHVDVYRLEQLIERQKKHINGIQHDINMKQLEAQSANDWIDYHTKRREEQNIILDRMLEDYGKPLFREEFTDCESVIYCILPDERVLITTRQFYLELAVIRTDDGIVLQQKELRYQHKRPRTTEGVDSLTGRAQKVLEKIDTLLK